MAGRGSPKGVKQGGRKPGTPNKVTREVREVFRLALEHNAPALQDAIADVLEADPAKGADLLLRLSERFIPTLARQEHSGPDDGPITIVVNTLAAKPD